MSDERKMIQIKRYRPLWSVVTAEINEDWDDLKKLQTTLIGGDSPSYIQTCIDREVLSVRTVLNRIQEFVDSDDAPPDYAFNGAKFDMDSMKNPLQVSLSAIDGLLKETPGASTKEMEKLMLLMFELGTHVGSINNQDLIIKGLDSIGKPYRAGHKRGKNNAAQATQRKMAYSIALKAAAKPTVGGLKSYLKSLQGKRFETGIEECPEIWIEGNEFFDSLGKYSESAVSKIRSN